MPAISSSSCNLLSRRDVIRNSAELPELFAYSTKYNRFCCTEIRYELLQQTRCNQVLVFDDDSVLDKDTFVSSAHSHFVRLVPA